MVSRNQQYPRDLWEVFRDAIPQGLMEDALKRAEADHRASTLAFSPLGLLGVCVACGTCALSDQFSEVERRLYNEIANAAAQALAGLARDFVLEEEQEK